MIKTIPSIRHDLWGSGEWNAPRFGQEKDHRAVDVTAAPGTVILAPFDGCLIEKSKAMKIKERPGLNRVMLSPYGYSRDLKVYFDFVGPFEPGKHTYRHVKTEEPIGIVQDIQQFYDARMQNHFQLRALWRYLDVNPLAVLDALQNDHSPAEIKPWLDELTIARRRLTEGRAAWKAKLEGSDDADDATY